MENSEAQITEVLFVSLEHNKSLPSLDLHGIRPEEVRGKVFNFLSEQINLNRNAARIIYGRGGRGVLRREVLNFLQRNMRETVDHQKLVKNFREQTLNDAGGSCVVLLKID